MVGWRKSFRMVSIAKTWPLFRGTWGLWGLDWKGSQLQRMRLWVGMGGAPGTNPCEARGSDRGPRRVRRGHSGEFQGSTLWVDLGPDVLDSGAAGHGACGGGGSSRGRSGPEVFCGAAEGMPQNPARIGLTPCLDPAGTSVGGAPPSRGAELGVRGPQACTLLWGGV